MQGRKRKAKHKNRQTLTVSCPCSNEWGCNQTKKHQPKIIHPLEKTTGEKGVVLNPFEVGQGKQSPMKSASIKRLRHHPRPS